MSTLKSNVQAPAKVLRRRWIEIYGSSISAEGGRGSFELRVER